MTKSKSLNLQGEADLNQLEIFKKAKLYPILDLDFYKNNNISLNDLLQFWGNFPDCISFFQLRAKSISESVYKTIYYELKNEFPNLPIIINDFWEFAIEVNAFGIHLGKEDFASLSPLEKNKFKASGKILKGTSSHNLEDLQNLDLKIWDYTGFGPLFVTNTKQSEHSPLGVSLLQKALLQNKIPLVPIGGINTENFASLFGYGKIIPASISMMADKKSLIKIVDFIRDYPHPV